MGVCSLYNAGSSDTMSDTMNDTLNDDDQRDLATIEAWEAWLDDTQKGGE